MFEQFDKQTEYQIVLRPRVCSPTISGKKLGKFIRIELPNLPRRDGAIGLGSDCTAYFEFDFISENGWIDIIAETKCV